MLPAAHRMHRSADFGAATRRGRRAGTAALVVHVLREGSEPAKVGLIVSKQVGNAVVRHRVARRLRHLMVPRLLALAPGTRLVIRANPAAAAASSSRLGHDLDRALSRLVRSR